MSFNSQPQISQLVPGQKVPFGAQPVAAQPVPAATVAPVQAQAKRVIVIPKAPASTNTASSSRSDEWVTNTHTSNHFHTRHVKNEHLTNIHTETEVEYNTHENYIDHGVKHVGGNATTSGHIGDFGRNTFEGDTPLIGAGDEKEASVPANAVVSGNAAAASNITTVPENAVAAGPNGSL